jgi:mono/diheme cytochrome c family protein
MRLIVIGLALVALSAGTVLGQSSSPRTPPVLTIGSVTGKDTFDAYCAPCHGPRGAGDGPRAAIFHGRRS